MKRLILIVALLAFTGCAPVDYEVRLINPQGEVHETHAIENMLHRPKVEKHFGGQTSITGHKHIHAPAGWYLDIDEVE
ncbi:MAG: hypothetical protein ACYSWO_28990 [Planctomycetota bacterium]|jgi:hypothetical protein